MSTRSVKVPLLALVSVTFLFSLLYVRPQKPWKHLLRPSVHATPSHTALHDDTVFLPSITIHATPPADTDASDRPTFPSLDSPDSEGFPDSAGCLHIEGADDVVLVLKTGASEARLKLPAHYNTTFRCAPHHLIYSNLEQDIDGHHVYDALDTIPELVQKNNSEFELYRQLQEYREHGKQNYSTVLDEFEGQKELNPAWRLDKWKFLPVLEKSYERHPHAKWYVFIEADTALLWSNLVTWLSMFNSTEPYYLGAQSWFYMEFGHGGSGFILSHEAMRLAKEALQTDPRRYSRVEQECCGDLIVAALLKELNVSLLRSWPTIQGETPASLDYTATHWCRPAVSYHHMSSLEVAALWQFEQAWLRERAGLQVPILHRDVFEHFVQPMVHGERQDWDNLSKDRVLDTEAGDLEPDEELAHVSFENCRAVCQVKPECIQYSYIHGVCSLGYVVRLGAIAEGKHKGMRSGWIDQRIADLKRDLDPCPMPQWITEK